MAIKKTKRGYQIRWYDSDGRERKRTYKGIPRIEAERLEREILAQRDRGDRLPDERRAPTFATFAAWWLQERRGSWKPSTRWQYEQLLRTHLLPVFGDVRITAVSES